MNRLALVVALCAACSNSSSNGTPAITAASPNFGPLSGGTTITLSGSGFLHDGAAPDQVLIGGREAPLAGAIDDGTLEVDLPPSDTPGDAAIVVFNHNGTGTATGLFHYSTVPTLDSVTPANVLATDTSTKMTISGTGFQNEGAGFLQVLIDGTPAVDVMVMSDTQLTFTALPGPALTRPELQVVNARGAGSKARAFRYVPSTRGGLLLFPQSDTNTFFYFFDPVDLSVITVLQRNPNPMSPRSIIIDPDGDYAVLLRDNRYGKVDFRTQDVAAVPDPIQTNNQLPAMVASASGIFAISRGDGQFGKFDAVTGQFLAVGTANLAGPCCGSFGVAVDSTGAGFVTNTNGIATMDLSTGTPGTFQVFSPVLHIQELRFLGPTLFGVTRGASGNSSDLVTINPASGTSAVVKTLEGRITSMEVFQ